MPPFTRSGFLPVLLAAALAGAPAAGRTDPPAPRWGERIEVASGGGWRGPWRMNASEFHYVDDPTVAVSDNGQVGVAWADQARKDIFFQLFEPGGKPRFKEPVNVSRSPRIFSWLPRLVIASRDASVVHALWQEIVFTGGSHGGEILFARSTDGGRTFGDPLNLSNTTGGAGKGRLTREIWHNGSLDLALGPEGNLYAAWTEYEGSLRFARSTDGGARFSAPLRIAGGGYSKPARGPSLAVDAQGTVYVAWTVGEDRSADIHFAKSADRGVTFGRPRPVFRSDGHADAPKIAVDGDGTVHLVYAESPAGPFEQYHVRYSRSRDGGRSFDKPRQISGTRVEPSASGSENDASANFPALGIDGKGRLFVIWELFPGRTHRSRGLGITFSVDGGRTFAPASLVPGSADPALGVNGSQQGLLMRKLAVSAAGAIAIVNSTFRANESSRVWLLRGETAGRALPFSP